MSSDNQNWPPPAENDPPAAPSEMPTQAVPYLGPETPAAPAAPHTQPYGQQPGVYGQPPAAPSGQPDHGQPGYSPPSYGQPAYSPPSYGQPAAPPPPGYGQPPGPPAYGQPSPEAPAYGQADYGQPGPEAPAYGQADYGQAAYSQPGYSQPAAPAPPPTYGQPTGPGAYNQPYAAGPGYAPGPATGDYGVQPFSPSGGHAPRTTGGGPRKAGGGKGMVAAGVVGGLAALGLLAGGVYALTSGGGDGTTGTTGTSAGTSPVTDVTVNPRIGTSVSGKDLQAGDCVNFDNTGAVITTFAVVDCITPHLAEIAGQVEHPEAGAAFPGGDQVTLYARDRCTGISNAYLGGDVLDTTLSETTLVPDFNDWTGGLYRSSCIVWRYDQSNLTESVKDKASAYPRSLSSVPVGRLKPGDCFEPITETNVVDIGRDSSVKVVDCTQTHRGVFFGRGLLPNPSADPYPGDEPVNTASVAKCDEIFLGFFGVPAPGINYRYWHPDQTTWTTGDRQVDCVVLDPEALPSPLDFSAYKPMFDLAVGTCFVLPPEETRDTLGIDDKVQPVDCASQYNGQVFYTGTSPSTGAFPGDAALDSQTLDTCLASFESFVGIDATSSAVGNFLYWFPSEAGWGAGDYRTACAVVVDEGRTGSTQNSRA
ncbi:MAG: septum formation family protein [Acidimicrobiales bacterium]